MKVHSRHRIIRFPSGWFIALTVAVMEIIIPLPVNAVGTWTALNSTPIPSGQNIAELLCDGTVLFINSGSHCYKLTPDIHRNYVNGAGTTLASMNSAR